MTKLRHPFAGIVWLAVVLVLPNLVWPVPQLSAQSSGRGVRPRGLEVVRVPFPNSVNPREALANFKAITQQTSLVATSGIPQLSGELRVARLLQVTSDEPSPGFLVLELETVDGKAVANVAMTREGVFMALEDTRYGTRGRSLDLSDASAKLRNRRGRGPEFIEYVYFTNLAEGGISFFRPLVAASTERGTIYFNSRAEAFVEESSPLVQELGASGTARRATAFVRGRSVELLSLGIW
jgi:hypothetical protein